MTESERLKRRRESQKKFIQAHPERRMQISRKYNYGISAEEYDAKVAAQDNKCAICNKPETRIDSRTGQIQALSVDHNHSTNEVRDLLCGSCNRALGLLQESEETANRLIDYLKKHRGD